jgi:feruloyl esterase
MFLRAIIAMFLFSSPLSAFAATCENVRSLTIPNAAITRAEVVGAGKFTPPAGTGCGAAVDPATDAGSQMLSRLPEFCRVAATLKPTQDSEIKVEIWMPTTGWNGKYLAVGNGGWAGTISYAAMAASLARGYATSSTDTGHSTPGGEFVVGHPEKWVDYAWRSVTRWQGPRKQS